jgi:hypothetical protein
VIYLHIVYRYCISLCVGIILRYLHDTYRFCIPTNTIPTDTYQQVSLMTAGAGGDSESDALAAGPSRTRTGAAAGLGGHLDS